MSVLIMYDTTDMWHNTFLSFCSQSFTQISSSHTNGHTWVAIMESTKIIIYIYIWLKFKMNFAWSKNVRMSNSSEIQMLYSNFSVQYLLNTILNPISRILNPLYHIHYAAPTSNMNMLNRSNITGIDIHNS